jgi:hypothetical protein
VVSPKPAKRRADHLPDNETIRELLLTWPVRQMRDVAVPPPPQDGGDDPSWSWKYEQKYGAPKLKEREEALRIALNVLSNKGKKDLGPIVSALQRIKAAAFENALLGLTVDLQRTHAEEADVIRRTLTKWLARAIDLHRRLNPDDLPAARRFRNTYEAMLTALTFDEPMTDQERAQRDWLFNPHLLKAAPLRRERQGNPDGRIVEYAHDVLSAAGAPREHHRDLLWAIGVVDEDGHLPRRNLSRR